MTMAVVIAVLAGAAIVSAALAVREGIRVSRSAERRRMIEHYSELTGHEEPSRPLSHAVDTVVSGADTLLARRAAASRMRDRLDAADVSLTVGGWIVVVGSAAATLACLLVLLGVRWVIALPLALVLAYLGQRIVLGRRISAARRRFEEDMPEFFLMLAGALRSGLPFIQALDSAAREGAGEIDRQMRRAIAEIQMGEVPEVALMRVADRMHSADLRWAVTALAIEREVGGNFATILDSVADAVRVRADIAREAQTLSAEGRMSARILLALPIVVFVLLFFFRREYVSVLWTTGPGLVMLAITAVLITVGWLWMRSLVKVRA